MKRAFALGVLFAILAPVAVVIVMACSAMPCCAAEQDRVARPMECCQPTMCASSSSARQPKATEASAAPSATFVAVETKAIADGSNTAPRQSAEVRSSPPRATSVRLALIATLLI